MQQLIDRYKYQCEVWNLKADAAIISVLNGQREDVVSKLNFESILLTSLASKVLLEAIKYCTRLEYLSLRGTNFRHEGVSILVSVCRQLPRLQVLDLSNNTLLNQASGRILYDLAKDHTSLTELDLSGTCVQETTKDLITAILREKVIDQTPRRDADKSPRTPGGIPSHFIGSPRGARSARDSPSQGTFSPSSIEKPLDPTRFMYVPPKAKAVETSHISATCDEVRLRVVDGEDKLQRMASDVPEKNETTKSIYVEKLEEDTKTIQEFMDLTQSIPSNAYSDEELFQDLKIINDNIAMMDLQGRYVMRPGAEPDDQLCVIVQRVMNTERGKPMTKEGLETSSACLEYGLSAIAKRLDHLVLANPVTVQTVLGDLFTTDELMKTSVNNVDSIQQRRNIAIEEDDMQKAEQLTDELIRQKGQLVELMQKRLEIVRTPGHELEILATLDEDKSKVQTRLQELSEMARNAIKNVRQDTKAIEDGKNHTKLAYATACDDFHQLQVRLGQDLHNNAQKQLSVWSQMHDLSLQLAKLADDRRTTIDRYIRDRDAYERRKGELENWQDVAMKHQSRLENMLESIPPHLDLYQNIELYTKLAAKTITDRISDVKRHIADTLGKERLEYLKHFGSYYKSIVELLSRKEERLKELNVTVDHLNFQLGMVKHSFDPNAPMYRSQLNEVNRVIETVSQRVDQLRTLADDAAASFEPIGEELRQAGIQYVHPVIEAHEINVVHKKNTFTLRREFTGVQQQKNLEEEDSLFTLLNTQKQAKSSNQPKLIPSLSPTKRERSAR